MKNWIKKQFVTKGFIEKGFFYSFTGYMLACGLVSFYQGYTDNDIYFVVGLWQMWGALIYVIYFKLLEHSRIMREGYTEIINSQFDLLNRALVGKDKPKEVDKNKGFTLIELLVLIAIIGILTAVLISAISKCKENGCGEKNRVETIRN